MMSAIIELAGQRFGRLVVVERNGSTNDKSVSWKCLCDCGNEDVVSSKTLRRGAKRSCGCANPHQFKDLTGKKFGRLTILGEDRRANGVFWKCLCDCGKSTVVNTSRLNFEHTQSCGCLQRETRRLPSGEAAHTIHYHNYKGAAKSRKLEFTLTKKVFRKLTTSNCFYCNKEPDRSFERRARKPSGTMYASGTILVNGVDRINNKLGYTLNNSVSCCWDCNNLKGARDFDEFVSHLKKIVDHLAKNKFARWIEI